ncbi:MAG: WYL domain-containing protein [Gammaproteobacteria bacterium]|nr:WYL domain-containing protein [Gammaproteobacteria bacterium]MBU1406620.1 WYL domain-containing protein [Gammaproteobacteria bacterium]MBU1530928.1 WYL domain-containing protein [Gammaproteobacteria bacterium]
MSKLDEIYRLHRLLDGRRTGLPRAALIAEHGFSRSTLTRLIADLRDKLGAPIVCDLERGGYRYDTADGRHSLPGLWFSPAELLALVTLKHLLANLEPGLLDDHLRPLEARIDTLLASQHLGVGEAAQRIRLLSIASRHKNPRHFQAVAHAVLQRHRLRIDYYNRERDQTSRREISPQRLAHYRDNWYLDAWCHDKKGLRIFAVECIRAVEPLAKPTKTVAESTLNRELASSYGIFAGQPHATAVLRFTAKRARWVAEEIWHPEQQSRWLEDGRYELRLPYSDDRELLMDILKYGADVEVTGPPKLREAAKNLLEMAAGQYQRGETPCSGSEPGGE